MHVLHLLATADRRGAEVFGVDLARSLDERGHRNRVVAIAPSTGATPLEVEVVAALTSPSEARALRSLARTSDVVVGHGSRGLVAGTLVTAANRTPLVYRSIGDPRHWGSTRARRARVGFQLRRAARTVALWPTAAEAIAERYGVPSERIDVIPNAADERRFRPPRGDERDAARGALEVPVDAPLVVHVGALSPEKRVARVIEGVAALPDVHLLLAGDGPDRPMLEELARRRLPGRHRFVGSLFDVLPVWHAADAAVLLSETEGQPGAVIEAALCAVATVATDVGGVASVIADGRTGHLVGAAASATEVATALRATLDADGALGAEARRRAAEDFSLAAVSRRWEDTLAAAIRSASAARP